MVMYFQKAGNRKLVNNLPTAIWSYVQCTSLLWGWLVKGWGIYIAVCALTVYSWVIATCWLVYLINGCNFIFWISKLMDYISCLFFLWCKIGWPLHDRYCISDEYISLVQIINHLRHYLDKKIETPIITLLLSMNILF